MAAQYDLVIDQGATFTRTFVYKDDDGNVIDLTDYEARMQIRAHPTSVQYVYSTTTDGGDLTITAGEGKVALEIPDDTTQAFPAPFVGAYDIEIESPDGVVTRLVEGSVRVTPNVTR